MGKRPIGSDPQTNFKRSETLTEAIKNEYTNYCPSTKIETIDVLELPDTPERIERFLKDYVIARKPCKINGVIGGELFSKKLHPQHITSIFPKEQILQVERKVDGGFGSGEKRLHMSFGDFMSRLKMGESDLYLTTQYRGDSTGTNGALAAAEEKEQEEEEEEEEGEGEEEEEEEGEEGCHAFADGSLSDAGSFIAGDLRDDFDDLKSQEEEVVANLKSGPLTWPEAEERIKELYQPPMDSLIGTLSESPEFLSALIPQQINLWIGATSQTNTKAQDEFLSNYDAQLPRLGLGRFVPGGGSSSGLHHDHADNLYVPVSGHKRFTLFSPKDAHKMYTVGTIRKVYASGVIDYARCENSPLWRNLRDDGAILGEVAHQQLSHNKNLTTEEQKKWTDIIKQDEDFVDQDSDVKLDPPSFSTVIPTVVHLDKIQDSSLRQKIQNKALEKWPLFFEANRIVVDLKPGEMLYLPAGWFHEVTSFGSLDAKDLKDQIHIAANYWFIPPNGVDLVNLYSHEDNYWHTDFERTRAALDIARQEVSKAGDD
ncbi:LAFA_0C09802g1_1 [Lachancea sp. 'fantastica']|nr:LAFA_0C09802g1_1 [Lachancea sp. 'fantastica']